MFVTTLGMDNFDCTKMNAHFKKSTVCLREGLIHKWKQALLVPLLPLILLNNSQLCSIHKHSSAFFSILQCATNDIMIRNFTDSEQFETPNTDCVLKFYKHREFYQIGFQVCWPWKFRGACHLKGRCSPGYGSNEVIAVKKALSSSPGCIYAFIHSCWMQGVREWCNVSL